MLTTPASNTLRLASQRGVTLVELILYGSLTAMLVFWVASWLSKPVRIQQKLVAAMDEQKALRATDTWVNDLKQTIPGSLHLDPSTDSGPLSLQIAGDVTPPGELPGIPISIQYTYQPENSGSGGSLYRTVDGTTTVILGGLLNPDSSNRLFQMEPVLRILTVDLRLKTAKGPALRVVRRVSIPN
jgi:hypothetical protein